MNVCHTHGYSRARTSTRTSATTSTKRSKFITFDYISIFQHQAQAVTLSTPASNFHESTTNIPQVNIHPLPAPPGSLHLHPEFEYKTSEPPKCFIVTANHVSQSQTLATFSIHSPLCIHAYSQKALPFSHLSLKENNHTHKKDARKTNKNRQQNETKKVW